MPSRKIELTKDQYYHIYNRGYNKQQLFVGLEDYERFWNKVLQYQEVFSTVNVLCWCLLPNHFHLLLIDREQSPGSEPNQVPTSDEACCISDFMRKIQQSYSMYFNAKYGESLKKGLKSPVFEGRFQAKKIEGENYLYQIGNYIEHNAVKHGLVKDVIDWPWSSFYHKQSPDFTSRTENQVRTRNKSINPESGEIFIPYFD